MAQDIFLKLGDIKGESQDARHKDEIDVLAIAWGVASQSSASTGGGAGGAGAGKPVFRELTVTHRYDKASPLLMRACALGQHLRDATLTVRQAAAEKQEFLTLLLNDLVVTSVAASEELQAGTEVFTLAFARIDVQYRSQKPDGALDTPIRFAFDLKTMREF